MDNLKMHLTSHRHYSATGEKIPTHKYYSRDIDDALANHIIELYLMGNVIFIVN